MAKHSIAEGKTVVITGCSEGGIGDALAQAFHRHGCRVFATARNLSKVQHLKESGIEVLELDVLSEESCKEAAQVVQEATRGALDILVNNSGIGLSMPLLDSNIADVKRVYDTNVIGTILAIQAFAPLLIAAKGTIINIGSIAGVAPLPWQSVYNSSKAAVNQLTDTLRLEMEPLGVKVILAMTGVVRTKFLRNLQTTSLPESSVYSAAKEIIEAAMSGKSLEETAMDVDVYAKDFVANALSAVPSTRYWSGSSSSQVWAIQRFFGSVIWGFLFRRGPVLNGVKDVLGKQKGK